jgi:hypothetical protein
MRPIIWPVVAIAEASGPMLAGSGFSNEDPVFLAEGGGTDGVFDEVVVDLDAAVGQIHLQGWPLSKGIVDGLTEQALGEMAMAGAKPGKSALQALHNWFALTGSSAS